MRWVAKAFLLGAPLLLGSIHAKDRYEPIAGNLFEESWRWTELDLLKPYVIRQAAKAPDGKLWLAVHGGIIRYDGYEVTPYLYKDAGWEEHNTTAIYVAGNGIVYCVTKQFGACLEDGEWTRLFEIENELYSYSSNSRIAEAADGSIWIASRSGLFRVNGNQARRVELESNSFSSLMIDRSNRLWLSEITRREILRIDLNSETGLPQGDPFRIVTRAVKSTDFIVEFTEGSGGRIWISANSDLHALRLVEGDRVKDVLGSWSGFGPTVQRHMLERRDGTLWVVTQTLIAEYRNNEWIFHDMGEFATWFSFMYPFDEDTLILGGYTDKTYRFDVSTTKWNSFQGLNFQCQDGEGRDWFISRNKRIVRFDPRDDSWISYDDSDGVIDRPIRMVVTGDGLIWASGSHNGLAAVGWYEDGFWSRNVHEEFAPNIAYHAVHEGTDKVLYFGSDFPAGNSYDFKGGILKYWIEGGQVEFSYDFPPAVPKGIHQIVQTLDQKLWMCNASTLLVKEGSQRAEPVGEEFVGNWVDNLSVDAAGNLWVLAWRTGVSQWLDGEWKWHTLPSNIRGDKPAAMLASNESEDVWVATNEGLSRFDGKTWFTHARLPELQLVRNKCRLVNSKDGSLWINIATDLWHENSSPLEAFRDEPFMTIRYSAGNRAPDTNIVHGEASIIESGNALISWSGMDVWSDTSHSNLHFSYRINQGPWSAYQMESQVLLESLESGDYVFEVRARDLDWNVDPTPAVFAFSVTPFLWKQTWFILLMLLGFGAIIGIALLLERMRVKHIIAVEEFKIDFFTNISHELRTPLSAIIGPLESMMKKKSADPLKGSLDMVYRNARRMLALVNQLLEFRKVELGKLKYEPVRSDLILFLKDVIYAHANLWERKAQQFQLNTRSEHRICCFDPDKLQHIVSNLISNAIKYTPPSGELAVTIDIEEKGPRGSFLKEAFIADNTGSPWLRLVVEDSGIGIAPERQEMIFKPFYRERDHQKDYVGSGIGLSYTFELVKLWGGAIDVESPIDMGNDRHPGTRFTVYLPLMEGDSSSQPVSSFVAKPLEPDVEVISDTMEDNADEAVPTSVLVVDDNADIREFLETELSEQYRILTAENGREGFDAAKEFHPDLILADLMMPVMDGLKMCSLLRTDKETSHIPILMLTARRSDEFRIKGIEHGADDYFSKPVNIELLKARIHSLLESRRLLRERFTRQIIIQPEEITVTPLDEQFLRKAIAIVQRHMRDEDFDVDTFSRKMGVARASLYRKMKATVGEAPYKFIRSMRLKRAAQLLKSGNYNVSQAMEQVGIEGLSHFGKIFKEEFGVTPSEYRLRHLKDAERSVEEPSLLDQSV